ncbi:MAG: hypothetical protein J6C23_03245 [Clostridia bacterium]|nr:hypothetical protein [Clostridia bacterium]
MNNDPNYKKYTLVYQRTTSTCYASSLGEASRIGMFTAVKGKTGGFIMARPYEPDTSKNATSSGFT